MSKTLADLQSICQYNGWHDTTTAGTTALTQFINDTIQLLGSIARWPFYINRSGNTLLPAPTTMTITAIQGNGTTVTVTATHALSAGDVVDISGTTAYNNGNVTVLSVNTTVSFTYAGSGTAAETSGTVTKHTEVSPAITACRIGGVYRTDRMVSLEEISLDEWQQLHVTQRATGAPNLYAVRESVSSGTMKLELCVYPAPTAATYLYFTYQAVPTILSGSSDATDWPDKLVWLLSEALKVRLSQKDRDSGGAALYGADFQQKVNLALAGCRPSFMPIKGKDIDITQRKQRIVDYSNIVIKS